MGGLRLTAEAVRGVFAIMPTPAVEGADDPRVVDTLDRVETERAVNALIGDGVDVLMSTGTFGECATLTWEELRDFAEIIVSAAAGRVPVLVGATTLNTRDTITRAKALRDIGKKSITGFYTKNCTVGFHSAASCIITQERCSA